MSAAPPADLEAGMYIFLFDFGTMGVLSDPDARFAPLHESGGKDIRASRLIDTSQAARDLRGFKELCPYCQTGLDLATALSNPKSLLNLGYLFSGLGPLRQSVRAMDVDGGRTRVRDRARCDVRFQVHWPRWPWRVCSTEELGVAGAGLG